MRVFLCEKPSQGRDVAAVLGCDKKVDGALIAANDAVTWGFGHVLSQANPEDYDPALKAWAYDTLPIIPSNWQMMVRRTRKNSSKSLKIFCSRQAKW